jgi:hypothetical protein
MNYENVILLMTSTKKQGVTLARFSEKLPDDGHWKPKYVGDDCITF